MRYLRQYIRQILVTEGMKTADLFPSDAIIVVEESLDEDGADIYYAIIDDITGESSDLLQAGEVQDKSGKPFYGHIGIGDPVWGEPTGPCGGAWHVDVSGAAHGWGPLLYDVAIEYATMKANGLIPDRGSVSEDAFAVWNYYLENRSQEVISHQLDNLENYLTPDIQEDNCDQEVAYRGWRKDGTQWPDSPLSKRYTKPPTTINMLKSIGKLRIL